MMRRLVPMVVALGLLLTGCVSGQPISSVPTTGPVSTVVTTRTTLVPPARRDITPALTAVHEYVTGAASNAGKVPKPTDSVDVTEGDVSGRLVVTQIAGPAKLSTSTTVTSRGSGDPSAVALTIRTTSTDPASTIDVMHRSSNAEVDYLLTGSSFRSAVPTAWVTVPQQYGNALGCVLPGRQTMCEVTADLLKNQKLDPGLPTNSASKASGAMTIRSAITVRQVLALGVWRMRKSLAPAIVAKASTVDLDQTLVPVVLQYNDNAGSQLGHPVMMTIRGRFTVGGVGASIDFSWSETAGAHADELDLPVPTRALYTKLDARQAKTLFALAAAGR